MNVHERSEIAPMAVGIFYGEKNPENAQIYFEPFVAELKTILQNGIKINGFTLNVSIRCFICDSPARAFVKGMEIWRLRIYYIKPTTPTYILVSLLPGTMNYNAIHGCQKCQIIGRHSAISHTVVFTKLQSEPRTDAVFRAGGYPLHQVCSNPFVELPLDMIRDFVVADPLHLIELGVMERLITAWKTGSMGFLQGRWSEQQTLEMSTKLMEMKTPQEIHRDA